MVGHENLLEFYLLATSHQQLRNRNATDYDVVDDIYLKHLKASSIPSNFKDADSSQDAANAMVDENDPSRLVSILGSYNPPQTCDIPQKLTDHHKSVLRNMYDPQKKIILPKVQNVDKMRDDDDDDYDQESDN